jgi:lipopolysaccharide transport system ATP-binding protein
MPAAQKAAGTGPFEERIYIKDIELFDEDEKPRSIFDFGERMRVRVKFEAQQHIKNPNFVIAFVRSDNVACCNYNTAMDGFHIPSLCGEGAIELLTPPLKLISDSYQIHVLVWDTEFQRRYGVQEGPHFEVRHHLLNTHFGVFHEAAEWFWPVIKNGKCQTSTGSGGEHS